MDLSAAEIAAILASGMATGLGGLALLIVRRPGERLLDALMGFTAGIMLAAGSSACSSRRSTAAAWGRWSPGSCSAPVPSPSSTR